MKKKRGLIALAAIVSAVTIWLLLDQKQDESPAAQVDSSPAPAPMTTSRIAKPSITAKTSPTPTANASPQPTVTPVDPDAEPDPYPTNEITLPPEGYGDTAHSVVSDLRTGADDDADLEDKLGSAYMPEDDPEPDANARDGARFTQQ